MPSLDAVCPKVGINFTLEIMRNLPTFFVAFIAVIIAWRQKEIAKAKLKLDLFERRVKVFDQAQLVLSLIAQRKKIKIEFAIDFHNLAINSVFLFDKPTSDYLFEIKEMVADYGAAWETALINSKDGAENDATVLNLSRQALIEVEDIHKKFIPFLSLSNWK